jgi:hypothetical protein
VSFTTNRRNANRNAIRGGLTVKGCTAEVIEREGGA